MVLERRNTTALGRKRRRDYDRSLKKLRFLGMPAWAVEYYSRLARVAGLPPHMVVCHVAVVVAGRQMQANAAQKPQREAGKAHRDGATRPEAIPSYLAASNKLAFIQEARARSERAGTRPRRRSGLTSRNA